MSPEFWLSWYSPEPMSAFELHSPWWVSGYTDNETIVVAAVRAESEEAAWASVRNAYDYPPEMRERFIEPLTGSPFSGRFPQANWMRWDNKGTCGCSEHRVAYYCPDCGHPYGYHATDRGCTMPLSQHGLPVSSLEVTVRTCGCRVIPTKETMPVIE